MEITQSFLKEHFEYCAGNLVWKKLPNKKGPARVGDIAGGSHPLGYRTIGINGVRFYAHRLIWTYHNGTTPEMIDHINGNRSDNRIENLRACNKSQNMMNMGASGRNSSGVKGVGWSASLKKWRAYLNVNGKTKHLGYFENIEDAKQAVSKVRAQAHGEFAKD